MENFRSLCADLYEYLSLLDDPPYNLVTRAEAALAEPNEEFWRRDALEKLLDAAMRFRLDVYSAEELELYEKRARFFLDRWDCPGLS